MNRPLEPTFDQRIADWLEDDPTFAPREVLSTVSAAFPSIEQRRASRVPWRLPTMFTNRLAVAALAAVLLIAGGGYALSRLVGPGDGPGGPVPTATPTPVPTPSPTPRPTLTVADVGTGLTAGTYAVDGFAVPVSVSVPDGWKMSALEEGTVTFELQSDGTTNLTLLVPNKVYADPCHTESGPTALESGVDALVTALEAMPGFTVAATTDATVGGALGKGFTFGNAIDLAQDGCSDSVWLKLGTYQSAGEDVDINMAPGESDQFWALDASGTTVLVAVTADRMATVQPVFDTLTFEESTT